MTTSATPQPAPGRTTTLLRFGVGLAVVAALVMLGRSLGHYVPQFADRVNALGAWGPVAFVLGYAVATVAFIPGSLLTLAAGAIFGLFRGTIFVLIGATIGASAAFLVSRYVASRIISQKVANNARFAAIDKAVAAEGRRIVFLLRLSPVFPFTLLNYALGTTRVRFVDYVVASVGMIPGTILYVYYGKLAGDVASLTSGAAVPRGAGYYIILGLGLAATLVVTTIVTRLARRALKGVAP